MTVKVPMALTRPHLGTIECALRLYVRGADAVGEPLSAEEVVLVSEALDFVTMLNAALTMERGQGFARVRLEEGMGRRGLA